MRIATLSILALFVSSATIAEACRCRQPPPPKVAMKKAAAVFAGEVTAIETAGRQNKVTFTITETWKGTKGKTVTVTTNTSSAACGCSFKKGKKYLIYAGKSGKGLSTNLCTRTKAYAAAKADLKALGDGMKPK